MKYITSALFTVAVLGLAACSDKEQKTGNIPAANVAAPINAPATGTAAQGEAVALNPAHGEPNHRCDIPEGAPLNSPVQPKLNVPTSTVTPPPLPPSQVPQGSVAPGTNPPHGQPGHDCSKPVGAPL